MKLFKYLQYIFLLSVLGISIVILYLWNIQQNLPDHNISQYFPNEITKIYDEKYELMYHVGNRDRFYLDYKDIPKSMICLLYTSPSPRDKRQSRMPSSA